MFKSKELIHLPAKEETNIVLDENTVKLIYLDNPKVAVWGWQHLYIISEEEIHEGDWFVDLIEKDIYKRKSWEVHASENRNYKKIIATTNISLDLPLIPNDFVKYYCNNDISEVSIEYSYKIDKSLGHFNQFRVYYLKVNSDKFINIKKDKTVYTKEQVLALCDDLIKQNFIDFTNGLKGWNDYEEWKNKNL